MQEKRKSLGALLFDRPSKSLPQRAQDEQQIRVLQKWQLSHETQEILFLSTGWKGEKE